MDYYLLCSQYISKAIDCADGEIKEQLKKILHKLEDEKVKAFDLPKTEISDKQRNMFKYLILVSIKDMIPTYIDKFDGEEEYFIQLGRFGDNICTDVYVSVNYSLCDKCKFSNIVKESVYRGKIYKNYSCTENRKVYRNDEFFSCLNKEQNLNIKRERACRILLNCLDDFIDNRMSLELYNSVLRIQRVSGCKVLEKQFIELVKINLKEEFMNTYKLLTKTLLKLCNQ